MKKLNLMSIILLAVAAVGLVLAIVGLAVPWYAATATVLGKSDTTTFGLFSDKLSGSDFPIACVQAFALITFIFAVAACAVLALNTLGIFQVKWLYRVICAGVVILFAVLTFIFGLVFAGQFEGGSIGGLASADFAASAGVYLLAIGAIAVSVPLFLNKD